MRTWGSFSTLEKGVIVVAVLLFMVLPLYAGLWKDPALVIALPFVLLFGLSGFFQFVAWAAGKLRL